ncbi:MAG: nitroreductase family protein [Pseudomonadota bacterium]
MFFDLIETRRSIRKFKPDPVSQQTRDKIIEAALRAPSSRGFNPWRFIMVDDPQLLDRLARAKTHGSSFLAGAPLGIVVLGDPSASDVWVEDASIASIYIHLAAHALGLGSCWIQIRNRDHGDGKTSDQYIKEVLSIPETMAVESILALGYPAQTRDPHPKESLQIEKVFMNRFGS